MTNWLTDYGHMHSGADHDAWVYASCEAGTCTRTIRQNERNYHPMKDLVKHLAWMVRHPIYAAKWHLHLGVRRPAR